MVISGYAEPMPLWCKQKKTQQLLILIAIIVVAFVGIGVALCFGSAVHHEVLSIS